GDPSELERGKLGSQVGAEPVFEFVRLNTPGDASGLALLGSDDQDGVPVEVPGCCLWEPVRRPQQELRDLRDTLWAGQIECALDLQMAGFGFIADSDNVIQDAAQGAFAERDDSRLHTRTSASIVVVIDSSANDRHG